MIGADAPMIGVDAPMFTSALMQLIPEPVAHRAQDYQLWFMTCVREEEERITYRHVPQDHLWMESSPH